MPKLTKVCPECSVSVNVKKSVCDCGHTFVLKRKVSIDATRIYIIHVHVDLSNQILSYSTVRA